MIELIEAKVEQHPGVKVWVAKDGSTIPMVRISEVADTAEARDRLSRFMAGQTMPLIKGANLQDYIYLHDYDNFLYNERTGKLKFFD